MSELNEMIEQFINGKYDAAKFCYDFNDVYMEIDTSTLDKEYIYVYDDINEACALFDDTKTFDKRLLNEKEFQEKVKEIYCKLNK